MDHEVDAEAQPHASRGIDALRPFADPAPVLLAEDLGLAVAGRSILDGVTMRLDRGTAYVLLGENGVGKTTLMRTLCGRSLPTRGRVRIVGRDPRADPAARRAIGYVPQSIALYPELTVRENLAAFAAYAGPSHVARVEADILAALRLEAVVDRRVGHLSGGYQRRVNLGAALVSGPALLVLDEPTVGLDGDAKAILLAVVRDAARRGAAILMTTHDLEAAASLGDRVGFLARGRIVAEGTIPALLDQAFGPRSAVLVRWQGAAPARLAKRFAECGLAVSEADREWRAPGRGIGPEAIGRVMEAVAADAAGLQRLTVSRPGLAELYAAVAKGDFGK